MNDTPALNIPSSHEEASTRTTMNGKPVQVVDSKTIINFKSGFASKLLCDGLTFTTGSACVYSCSFCYVSSMMMHRNPHDLENPENHANMVVRRSNPVEAVKKQLCDSKGRPKFLDPQDQRVCYASPLVDVAANMELVRETIAVCEVILELTNWQIRLLSKSNLLPRVAMALERHRDRLIFGVSSGTLDDQLAAAFEAGTAKVSKRLESLHWLQNNGFRTYGMLCPSLPQEDATSYSKFAEDCAEAIRADRCEHVWAEVMNLRGDSFTSTYRALLEAGHEMPARRLETVTNHKAAWEHYARATFEAHARVYSHSPGKLRFLQYVSKPTRSYWETKIQDGAVIL